MEFTTKLPQVIVGDYSTFDYATPGLCGVLFQYPNSDGKVIDYSEYIKAAHANKVSHWSYLFLYPTVRIQFGFYLYQL